MTDLPLEPWPLRGTAPDEPTPKITKAISDAADRLADERAVIAILKRNNMPPLIELKGLGSAVADIKKMISETKSEAAGLSQDGAQLLTAIKDVRTQVKAHFDDLKFEAEALGNGGTNSGSGG